MGNCKHADVLDSVDVARRPIRTCSSCGHRFVCLTCNDTHRMWHAGLERDVLCTRCPLPCRECRAGGTGAYCTTTPCSCDCHERKHYGYWNGMCEQRKHGLDYEGQACDVCKKESDALEKKSTFALYGDDDLMDVIDKVNETLTTRGLVLADISKEGADHCVFRLTEK